MSRFSSSLNVFCAVMLVCGLSHSIATTAQELLLEEIVITAQKREQNLQDTPVSITVFSGDDVRRLRFDDAVDLAIHTPSLNIGTPFGDGTNTSITIRGVGMNDFNDNNEGNVALYIDDIYYSFLAGNTFQLFDIERVEVLRGPQGTLYGRNATGGLIHYISRLPTKEYEAWGELSAGSYSLVEFEGAISGPLSDSVQGRLAVNRQVQDGYVENRIGSDRNEKDNWSVRGLLNFDISDRSNVLLNVHSFNSDTVGPTSQAELTDPAFGFDDTDNDPHAGEWDRDTVLDLEGTGGSVIFNWGITENISLTSITGYDQIERTYTEDTDNSPLDLGLPTFITDADQLTQELRLSGASDKFDWLAGFYYFDRDDFGEQDLALGIDVFGLEPPADGSFLLDTQFIQKTTSKAVFGQLEWRVSEQVALLFGLRVTNEEKEYDYEQVDRFGGVVGAPAGPILLLEFNAATVGSLAKIDNTTTTGKVGINWTPNEDWLVFASASRGSKSAGFNAGFVDPTDANGVFDLGNIRYKEEILDSIEVGFKSTWLDGALRLNATIFDYNYKDQQILTFTGISSFVTNGDSKISGGELEIVTSPTEGLNISFGASILDSEVTGVRLADGSQVLNGVELILAPKWTLNGLVRYEWPVGNGHVATQVDYSYQGAHYFDITNAEISRENGYGILNASVTYQFADDRYAVTVWGKNVTDEEYLVYTFDFTLFFGINQNFFGPPAMFGVSFLANF